MRVKDILHLSVCVYLFSFSLIGCTPRKRNEGDLIHINVRRTHPIKEIRLEEIASIEFLQLKTHEVFLFREMPQVVTDNKVIISERSTGDILTFSRDGEPLSVFNRRGNGPEEYTRVHRLIYDENSNELFIMSDGRIVVYSISGKFRRAFSLLEEAPIRVLASFNSETLILYDHWETYPAPFMLISKKDGEIIRTINMPRGETIHPFYVIQDEMSMTVITAPAHHIVKYNNGFLLTDFSLDTVFFLSQNKELTPILTRSPAIQSMSTITYLNSFVEAGNYQFFSTVTLRNENNKLPITYLMRNKTTGLVYRQRITFDDFRGREIFLSPTIIARTQNSRLGLISLDLTELQDANDEGRLSGRLREIVEKSEEDGNNVFMLLHFK